MKEKKTEDETNARILSANNPEIFVTPPRPGGYVKLLGMPSSQRIHSLPAFKAVHCGCPERRGLVGPTDRTSVTTVKSNMSRRSVSPSGATFIIPSREFRLNSSIVEKEAEGFYSDEDAVDQPLDDDPLYKSAHMLAATVSTVMMMAAGINNIPSEYFAWTVKYLECQKDEDDRHPYNINGILNHIQYVKMGYANEKKKCGGSKCMKGNTGQKPPHDSGARSSPQVSKGESSYNTANSTSHYNTSFGPKNTDSSATNKTDSNRTVTASKSKKGK